MASDDTFTASVPKQVKEHENFEKWENKVDGNIIIRIEAAKEKILNQGLITNSKDLKNGLFEKKWNNGLRLYFSVIEEEEGHKTLLLLGSGKGKDQERAIRKSREALDGYLVVKEDIRHGAGK